MARSTKRIVWYELGHWTYDDEGGAEWHVIGAYDTEALIDEDMTKAESLFSHTVLVKRKKAVEVITG